MYALVSTFSVSPSSSQLFSQKIYFADSPNHLPDLTGEMKLSTQTMHSHNGIPDYFQYICSAWTPQNGSHLMTPDMSKWFLYFLSHQPWMLPWNFRNDYIVAPRGVNSSTNLPIKWGLRTDCCPSSHNHGWVKIGCISNSSCLLTYQNFPLIHDYGRKSEFFQGSSNSLVSNLVASPLLLGSDHCWMDVQFQTIAGRGSQFTGPPALSEIDSN